MCGVAGWAPRVRCGCRDGSAPADGWARSSSPGSHVSDGATHRAVGVADHDVGSDKASIRTEADDHDIRADELADLLCLVVRRSDMGLLERPGWVCPAPGRGIIGLEVGFKRVLGVGVVSPGQGVALLVGIGVNLALDVENARCRIATNCVVVESLAELRPGRCRWTRWPRRSAQDCSHAHLLMRIEGQPITVFHLIVLRITPSMIVAL
jgi:hypothetical protein